MVVFEEVTPEGNLFAKYLDDLWKQFGRPDDINTNTGEKLLDEIIRVWQASFPEEVSNWIHDRQMDIDYERTMSAHLSSGGYNPVAYPPTLYQLIKIMLPKAKLQDKITYTRIANRYPKLFKTTNYAL